MNTNRRAFLGNAALAGGMVALAGGAAADAPPTKTDKGTPGQGGAAFDSVELPPGATVAYHNPNDVGAMPDFRYEMDATAPKITSGGWAKEATVHHFPIAKGLAAVHMFLDPGA